MEQKKGEPLDEKAKEALKTDVMSAVDECLASEYASKDECIDAIVAKLEALKGDSGPAMGGLGTADDEPMALDDAAEEEGE